MKVSRVKKLNLVAVICFALLGCQDLSDEANDEKNSSNKDGIVEKKENNMNDVDVYDFENMGKAPEVTEAQNVEDTIKVFFSESTFDDPDEPIAFNLKDSEIYINPSLSLHGFSSYDEAMELNNVEEVLDILRSYDVQSWKKDYTFKDSDTYEDGYIWRLWLQYEDGTVEKHKGEGTDRDIITPSIFDYFVKDLNYIVDKHFNDD